MQFQTREEYKRYLVKERCFTPDEAEQYIDMEEMREKQEGFFNNEEEVITIEIDKEESKYYE